MDFNDIRPYSDKDVPSVLKRLAGNRWLIKGIRLAYFEKLPKIFNRLIERLIYFFLRFKTYGIKTSDQFREKISLNILIKKLVIDTTDTITSTGLENLDLKKSYIFISNHRDIVLDPAFMISILYNYGFNFPQIAFGDNLMVNDIVTDIIRINNGIIVRRNLPMRQQIDESFKLSAYMCSLIEKGTSIWVSQREGRSKDGLDKTNPAVLKMLYLSKRKEMDFTEFLEKYLIIPVSISYEYDPLDRAKSWSIYREKIHGSHIKRKYEDLIHIASSFKGYKGNISLSFSEPLSSNLKDETAAARILDEKIHRSYKLWKTNYISYDLHNNCKKYDNKYTNDEVKKFLDRYKGLSLNVKDIVLKLYANPVTNYENYITGK